MRVTRSYDFPRMPSPTLLAALAVCACWSAPASSDQVYALALHKDRAFLKINDQQHIFRVGGESHAGLKLLAADASSALVLQGDRLVRLTLADGVGMQVARTPPNEAPISVPQDQDGLFSVGGQINGRPANFIIDTGANHVSLTTHHADRLGIRYTRSEPISVKTAGSLTVGYSTTLDSVSVGSRRLRNVSATVINGSKDLPILLGMTFLENFQMELRDGVVLLGPRARNFTQGG